MDFQKQMTTDGGGTVSLLSASRLFLASVLLVAIFIGGCGDNGSGSRVFPSAAKDDSDPTERAKEDFDWAMERLHRAVQSFRPASSLGMRVQREMTHELQLADNPNEPHRAVVTISTKTFYDHEPASDENGNEDAKKEQQKQNKKKNKSQQSDGENAFLLSGDESQQEVFESMEEIPELESAVPKIVEPKLEPRTLEEKDEFDLIYKDGQWQLVTQPEVEHVRMWFEYALEL